MIDLHSHILPGRDDGSPDLETSLKMAKMAAQSGIKKIVATPHSNLPGVEELSQNYVSPSLEKAFKDFQSALSERHIDLEILPGAEIFCTPDVPELLQEGRLQTLNNSAYLLTEFMFDETIDYMDRMLHRIQYLGLTPVLAHPERYYDVQENLDVIERWFAEGFIIQVNKGSLLGRLGEDAQEAAVELLDRGHAHVVATDAHFATERTPHMGETELFLLERYGHTYTDILLNRNPARIIQNRPVIK